MDPWQDPINKLGKKNIIGATVFFLVFGCLYAVKKGSLAEALFPTLLGLVLFIGGALYLAMISSKDKK